MGSYNVFTAQTKTSVLNLPIGFVVKLRYSSIDKVEVLSNNVWNYYYGSVKISDIETLFSGLKFLEVHTFTPVE